jgi:hypothetical protein
MFRRFCSTSWLSLAVVAYLAAFGLSIWSIVLAVRALNDYAVPPCGEILRTFLIGSIAACALVLLAYGAGVGAVFLLVWALLGQMWYNDARDECAAVPHGFWDAVRTCLIILWFDLASFLGFAIGSCVGCWCSISNRG